MKTLKALVYITICLTIFSCSRLEEGTIVDKFYEESRIKISYLHLNNRVQQIISNDDEDYVFIVRNVIENDTITERFEVTKNTYNSYEVGDWIKFKQ